MTLLQDSWDKSFTSPPSPGVNVLDLVQAFNETYPAAESEVVRQRHIYAGVKQRLSGSKSFGPLEYWIAIAAADSFPEHHVPLSGEQIIINETNSTVHPLTLNAESFRRLGRRSNVKYTQEKQSRMLNLLQQIRELSERILPSDASSSKTLERAKIDALTFIAKMPNDLSAPLVSTAEDGEIVMEWKEPKTHAVVDFEGDGLFGYALLQQGRFIPGKQEGNLSSETLPADLIEYLRAVSRS